MHPQIGDAGSQASRQPAARVSHDAVLAWMREHLASLLGVIPDDLDPHENFLDLGVDSVQAMALLEALAGRFHGRRIGRRRRARDGVRRRRDAARTAALSGSGCGAGDPGDRPSIAGRGTAWRWS